MRRHSENSRVRFAAAAAERANFGRATTSARLKSRELRHVVAVASGRWSANSKQQDNNKQQTANSKDYYGSFYDLFSDSYGVALSFYTQPPLNADYWPLTTGH